ncbi:MAG TPA: SAM-dependent methyltransferase [Burkholderiaceae bacterium]|nr:SAM-dependent methyltransferase [Burkholderiaceae bacterium]
MPSPPAEAVAASRRLAARVVDDVAAAGGWIGFDRYMARVLYEPVLGYYSGGAAKLGAAGDFVTAPMISPLFGQCVAAQCLQWFDAPAALPRVVTEFGAGGGELAAQLLAAFDAAGLTDLRYDIVELSAELAQRQRDRIACEVPQALPRVRWLHELPPALSGVVLGNELLDAMPVRLFVLRGGQVFERGVTVEPGPTGDAGGEGGVGGVGGEGGDAGDGGDAGAGEIETGGETGEGGEGGRIGDQGRPVRFGWRDRPADPAFAGRVAAALADAERQPAELPDGYLSELNEQAEGWVSTIAGRLERGVVLLFDYGFPAAEYYHPQRGAGTVMCHYRHRAHADPFRWPGLQDITAHVQFDAIARAASSAGCDLLGYTTQAHFLLNCGLIDALSAARGGDAFAAARDAAAVQRLVSEAEMGELVKVIAFGRGVDDDAIGFARGDRRHRLVVDQQGPR